MRKTFGFALAMAMAGTGGVSAEARSASLRGSPASMIEQNAVAKDLGLNFYRTRADIMAAVDRGDLVHLPGNADYAVSPGVQNPYLHPAAALFVERLAAQYHAACGQRLVVTSAVRPASGQPRNAHALSVHPAGMAVDLRVSDRAECRGWLESALMRLEGEGVLNGIRENRPPHYHIAVYPEQYLAYAAPLVAREAAERAAAQAAEAATRAAAAEAAGGELFAKGNAAGTRAPLLATLALLLAVPVGRRVLRDRRSTVRADNPGRRAADRRA